MSDQDPKKFFEEMDVSDKVWHFSSDPNTALFAHDTLLRHLSAAKLQVERIQQAQLYAHKEVAANGPEDPNAVRADFKNAQKLYGAVFIEIHFYFISWVNCQNMMKVLASLPEFSNASHYFNSVRNRFDEYAEARNTFEHLHDRLPAGTKHSRVREVRAENAGPRKIFGGLERGAYKFSDRSWDITPASFSELERMVTEFLNQVYVVIDGKYEKVKNNA